MSSSNIDISKDFAAGVYQCSVYCIDCRYSQSRWYSIATQLCELLPFYSNLFSPSTLPPPLLLPFVNKYTV
jgi:hypothetical protein